MKTLLLTGADGFVGIRAASRFSQDPSIRLLRLVHGSGNAAAHDTFCCPLERLTPSFWTAHGIDRIDAVAHLAAFMPKTREEASAVEPIVSSNIRGIIALLDSLPSVPRAVVFVSSIDVYARSATEIDEQSVVSPATLYGASKVFGEQLVRDYARRAGCHFSIARLGHTFGPGEERFKKVIPNLIRGLLRGEEPTLSGTGSTERDFLYVDDAVDVLSGLLDRAESVDPVNLVRGESTTILNVARCIAEIVGYHGTFRFAGTDDPPLRFNATRVRELMGSSPFVSLRDGLQREVEYFRSLP